MAPTHALSITREMTRCWLAAWLCRALRQAHNTVHAVWDCIICQPSLAEHILQGFSLLMHVCLQRVPKYAWERCICLQARICFRALECSCRIGFMQLFFERSGLCASIDTHHAVRGMELL